MHLILTGATGLVGSGVLDAVLSMPEVTRISILSRRPVPMLEARVKDKDPLALDTNRVKVFNHSNFLEYDDELLQQLRGASGVVWALGISQTQVDKEEYVRITHDYPLAAAKAFQKLPAQEDDGVFRFVYVSGEGATTKPGAMTARFGRVKGETEVALAEITNTSVTASGPFRAISVRPGGVDPTDHPAILPYIPTPSFTLRMAMAVLGPPLRTFYPSGMAPTQPLGRFLAETAIGKFDGRLQGPDIEHLGATPIVANVAFRRLAGVSRK